MVALGTTSPFLVVLFGTIMFLVILQNYLRASSIAGRLRDESAVPLYSYFTESAAGLHYIRSFGWQHQRKEHLYELVDKYQRAEYHIENVRRWLSSSYDFVSLILALLVIFSAVYLESSPSAVAVAFFYLFQFTSSGEGSVRLHSRFTAQCDSLVRIHNFVESTPLEAGPNDDIELHEGWPRNGKVLFEKISVWHNK